MSVFSGGITKRQGGPFLFAAAPWPGGGGVVTGNLSSIDATGWSGQANTSVLTLPTMTTNGTSEFGADGGTPKTVALTRQGFDATGAAVTNIAENLIVTKRVRQPYPNQALATTATVALSDYVYSTDTVAGATNGSGEVSPTPVANWIMPHRLVVNGTIDWEISAWHRNARSAKQVACVWVRATDGTTTTAWQVVSATQVSGRTGDRYPVVCHKGSLDISSLANNSTVTLEGWVFPWIGTSATILKSSASSEARGFSPRTFFKTSSGPTYVYVASIGNDTTGVASTTQAAALASPCLTVMGAITKANTAAGNLNNTVIYVVDGVNLGASVAVATAQSNGSITITRASGSTRAAANVTINTSARAKIAASGNVTTSCIRYTDLTITRGGALTFAGEATTAMEVIFDDVDLNVASQGSALISNASLSIYGMTATNAATSFLAPATYEVRCIRGLQADLGSSLFEGYLFIGSALTNCGAPDAGTRSENGSIRAFFSATLADSTKSGFTYGTQAVGVTGAVLAQGIVEYKLAATASACRLSGDGYTGSTNHVIHHHMTHAGAFIAGRNNDFYNETGPGSGTVLRTHKLMSVVGDLLVQQNTKHDVFAGSNLGYSDASSRIGGWSFLYGVGCYSVYTGWTDANNSGLGSSFAQAWPGLACKIGTSATAPQQAEASLFTANAGTTFNGTTYTAGAGGGTYTLQSGALPKGMVTNGVLSHDLAGGARSATTSAGAYQ